VIDDDDSDEDEKLSSNERQAMRPLIKLMTITLIIRRVTPILDVIRTLRGCHFPECNYPVPPASPISGRFQCHFGATAYS